MSFCLELLLTGGQEGEILHTPEDLVAWLAESGLEARVSDGDLHHVKKLRNVLCSVMAQLSAGERPDPADLRLINRYASQSPQPRIDPDTLAAGWVTPIWGMQIAGLAARDAINVIPTGRVRRCEGDSCNLLYLDTSRPGNRRWCSMERCGNRQKVRALRARQAS